MKRIIKASVPEAFNGQEAGVFLRKYLLVSGTLLKKLKKLPDGIVLNGKRIFTNEKLHTGDEISISVGDGENSENIISEKGALDILYEDEDILAVNKGPRLPVHPSKGHVSDSLANRIAYYYENRGEKFVFRCVTRLDKDTSGVCLIAKNAYAHDLLTLQFSSGKIEKTYVAAVVGEVTDKSGTIDKNIRRLPNLATIKRETCENGDGKRAITNFKVLQKKNGFSLLEIKPETGRTHQIRVHLSSEGFPIAGDWLYGKEGGKIDRQALHCEKLSFIHPIKKEKISLFAPVPDDISSLFL